MSLTAGSYCGNISTTLVDKNVESLRPNVTSILDAAGYVNDTAAENILLNAISYYGRERVAAWKASGETQDAYFTTLDPKSYIATDLAQQTWRSWDYQVCTEWGYIQVCILLWGSVHCHD